MYPWALAVWSPPSSLFSPQLPRRLQCFFPTDTRQKTFAQETPPSVVFLCIHGWVYPLLSLYSLNILREGGLFQLLELRLRTGFWLFFGGVCTARARSCWPRCGRLRSAARNASSRCLSAAVGPQTEEKTRWTRFNIAFYWVCDSLEQKHDVSRLETWVFFAGRGSSGSSVSHSVCVSFEVCVCVGKSLDWTCFGSDPDVQITLICSERELCGVLCEFSSCDLWNIPVLLITR